MTPPQVPEREPAGPWWPNTINYSFWAGIASVVVGFAMLASAYLLISDADLQLVLQETAIQGQQITLEQARGIYLVVLAVMTAIVAVVAALWIMFLFFMRRGRNWARIVITVVGALWFLLTIPSVAGGSTGGSTTALLAVLQLLAVGATLVFAYLAPSNQYFQLARRG
ncbi:hypothetical protein [Saccharopolyspora sp. 5N708]|uniref:hypothetical protein n=1 Tax=Saccharopolyspora sp. 5N708 TaxID=3457424 RepID=UPI003FD2BB28